MSRLERSALALAVIVAGCATRGEGSSVARGAASAAEDARRVVTEAPPAPPPADVAAPSSPFHLALVEADWHGEGPSTHAEPCAVRGRTLICNNAAPLVSGDDGMDEDPALSSAMGAVEGTTPRIEGRWPDDARMVTYDRSSSTELRRAYQWAHDRWTKLAGWMGDPRFVARWGDGLLVDAAQDGDYHRGASETWRAPLSLIGPDGTRKAAPTSALVARLGPGSSSAWTEIDRVASVDGAVFVVARPERPAKLLVQRWLPDGSRSVPFELAPRAAKAHLWTESARDVVAFGGATDADEKPVLFHFDGEGWAPIEPPPGVDIIVGYDRSRAETERVFAFRGEELSLWERLRGGTWQPLVLPALAADESIDGHWVTDDDAWLHVRSLSHEGRLLRLRPVKHVYRMGAHPVIEPVTPDTDRLAAARPSAPPVAAPEDDPSPFHDAVIDYPVRLDAMLASPLRLCPSRGRTLVCGVTLAPLLSTDDGVVNDVEFEARIASGKAQPPADTAPGSVARGSQKTWSVAHPPEGVDRIAAYDRTSDGTERVFAFTGETASLFERRSAGAWAQVPLPRLEPGDKVHDVWLANDDAWILVWPNDMAKHPPRLMRTRPVKKVWTAPRPLPDLGW